MDLSTLSNWLWRAACSIRGDVDAARYKDFILPLIFYKRVDDVYEGELTRLGKTLGIDAATAELFVEEDHNLVRFYLPQTARWRTIRGATTGLGERVTDNLRAIARANSVLEGVIDRRDFNATEGNQRLLDDNALGRLISILSEQPLGLDSVAPDLIGRAYEYLIGKFAEKGSSAGEFFTPTSVGYLIARVLDPEPGDTIYDPTSGSAGLLIKTQLRHRQKLAVALGKPLQELKPQDDPHPLELFGQELQADNVAAAKMNAFLHDMTADIRQGNTMSNPLFVNPDGSLRRFHKISANPMWNQEFGAEVYNNDSYGRFDWGAPPAGTADWGWVQHMYASLEPGGRMACVLDTGAVSRGSGNRGRNAERDIRKQFVEADAVDAVVLLPDNLFFNTSAPGIILVLRKANEACPRPHADEMLLINAGKQYVKGRPKNEMSTEHVDAIGGLYLDWQEQEGVSKRVPLAEIVRNDYNLSPSRYVSIDETEPPLPLEDAIVLLREAEEARAEADDKLDQVLAALGFEGWRG